MMDDDDDIDNDVDDGYISRAQISHLNVLQPLGEHQLLVDCHSQQLEIKIVVFDNKIGYYNDKCDNNECTSFWWSG